MDAKGLCVCACMRACVRVCVRACVLEGGTQYVDKGNYITIIRQSVERVGCDSLETLAY